jgi:hypothetical protein
MGIFDNEKAERELAKTQYYFNVERKITTWVRELHSITAESKEDAIEQMILEFKKDELGDTETYVGQEHLFDCETYMDIEDNSGNATAELYFDGTYENKNREFLIDNLNKNEI